MKKYTIIIFAACFFSVALLHAQDAADISGIRADMRGREGDFSISKVLDFCKTKSNYAISYSETKIIHSGKKYDLKQFDVFIIRTDTQEAFDLYVVENPTDELHESDNPMPYIKKNAKHKTLGFQDANLIYKTWIRALSRSRLGGIEHPTGYTDFYYISAMDFKNGEMAALSREMKPKSSVEAIVTIARRIRDYGLATNAKNAEKILLDVRAKCNSYLANFPND